MAKQILDVSDWKDMKIIVTHYHILLVCTLAISQIPVDRLYVLTLHSTIKAVRSLLGTYFRGSVMIVVVSPIDRPSPHIYRFQKSSSSSALTFTCETRTAPPTEIAWQRNGVSLSIDGNTTRMTQTITNCRSTYYTNTLSIYGDPDEMEGRYTCSYGNRYSSRVTSSSVTVQGI